MTTDLISIKISGQVRKIEKKQAASPQEVIRVTSKYFITSRK